MMRNILVFVLIVMLVSACDAQTTIRGHVTDKNNNPIPSAKVWLVYGSWSSDSDVASDGRFSVTMIHGSGETPQFIVIDSSHKTYTQPINNKDRKLDNLHVILEEGAPTEITAKESPGA
ncbi:carboxypeptidase-like regulatory domain-containing protein [Andreprevotia sp. IGB-42]|uniref:carboxypeptidase-like regulatory domain-containing protein n=1 Tax=Andreprevotia sp. IGB-42 TaxID=2497473 RepID=UPI0013583C12|nr:carboxypeptidase-like regulatory domain-containing protein [Andreprevotia sp. IGB-42]